MINTINIGDKVICINNTYCENLLTLGKVYIVMDVYVGSIMIQNDISEIAGYYKFGFDFISLKRIETIDTILA